MFIRGTEPTEYCTERHHTLLRFPYPFHRYTINERGELAIPANELDRLLDGEVNVFLVDGGTRLEAYTPQGMYSLPLQVLPARPEPVWPGRLTDRFDRSEWTGLDGRPAQVTWLD